MTTDAANPNETDTASQPFANSREFRYTPHEPRHGDRHITVTLKGQPPMTTDWTTKPKTCVDCGEQVDTQAPESQTPARCWKCRKVHVIETATKTVAEQTDRALKGFKP